MIIRKRFSIRQPLIAISLCMALLPLNSLAEEELISYGDWGLNCEGGEDEKMQTCFAYQNLMMKDGDTPLLHIAAGYPSGNETPFLLITVPLGTALTPGLMVNIEGHDPVKGIFQHCMSNGCNALVPVGNGVLNKMRHAKSAWVTFIRADQQGIKVPLSVNGLDDALTAVEENRLPLKEDLYQN